MTVTWQPGSGEASGGWGPPTCHPGDEEGAHRPPHPRTGEPTLWVALGGMVMVRTQLSSANSWRSPSQPYTRLSHPASHSSFSGTYPLSANHPLSSLWSIFKSISKYHSKTPFRLKKLDFHIQEEKNRNNLERIKIPTEEISQWTLLRPLPTLPNFNSPSVSQISACYYYLYYETLSPLTIITPFIFPVVFPFDPELCVASPTLETPSWYFCHTDFSFSTFLLPSLALFSLLGETHPGWKGCVWTEFNFLYANICDRTAWPFKTLMDKEIPCIGLA